MHYSVKNSTKTVKTYVLEGTKRKYSGFGAMIKSERERRGWTLMQLYLNVNHLSSKGNQIVSYESLLRWERGDGIPQIESTVALSKAFGKPDLIQLRVDAVELAKKNPHERELTRIQGLKNIL